MQTQRIHYIIIGQVQGVGFRPFVYRVALERGLSGHVCNAPEGVLLEIQGPAIVCADFEQVLRTELPPLAKIDSLQRQELTPLDDESGFKILPSRHQGAATTLVSPDMGICQDCLEDMKFGRRTDYPFTNCTNCGPRYSIIGGIPYDRPLTSMACFPMCAECRAEYENPLDRRFHAQPNACSKCGPKVWLIEDAVPGKASATTAPEQYNVQSSLQALRRAAELLLSGYILAMKGLGGFHLVCDVFNTETIACLRLRKQRPHKALAIMVDSLESARQLAKLRPEDEALLLSPERPIVLCPKHKAKEVADSPTLPDNLSPDSDQVGVMLPYTPMQQVLFNECRRVQAECGLAPGVIGMAHRPLALVMTSGNPSGQPLCIGNREALRELRGLADYFLLHDRDILIRVDDSVVVAQHGVSSPQENPETLGSLVTPASVSAPQKTRTMRDDSVGLLFLRRARGYAPAPIALKPLSTRLFSNAGHSAVPSVLGLGAELKNSICLTRGNQAFVSQHIGDLDNLESANFQREILEHLCKILETQPEIIVHDLHPDFLSTRFAKELAVEKNIQALPLQHHFAHARALAAEHRLEEPFLCLTLDGTGLGTDGTVWGGELLLVDPLSTTQLRLGALSPLPLVGGDLAVREPWRQAWAALEHLGLQHPGVPALPFGASGLLGAIEPEPGAFFSASSKPLSFWLNDEQKEQIPLLSAMLQRGLNTVWSSSCGRLFDAVSALCGLCHKISYEGQAALYLEKAQNDFLHTAGSSASARQCTIQKIDANESYALPLLKNVGALSWQLDVKPLFTGIIGDLERQVSPGFISRRFHLALSEGFANMALEAAREHGIKTVGLSGGCLQNQTLFALLVKALRQRGLHPLWPEQLPPGDGGLSLGQAAYARICAISRL